MRAGVKVLTLCFAALAVACGDDAPNQPSSSGAGASGSGGSGGTGAAPYEPTTHGDCDGVAAGFPENGSLVVGLSRAHASYRFFGDHGATQDVDQRLVGAMRKSLDDEEAILSTYVEGLSGVCAIETTYRNNRAVRVDLEGGVAWVRYGEGEISIPAEAASVFVDLRGAEEGPTLPAFLEAVGAAVLDSAPAPLEARTRLHSGMRDEVYAPIFLGSENVYDDSIETVELPPLTAGAAKTYELAVVAGPRIAPSAARFALALRASGRAALLGHPIRTAVAESVWAPVATFGLVHRVATLHANGAPLPDVVVPDVAGDDDTQLAEAFAMLGELPVIGGEVTRPDLEEIPNTDDVPASEFDRASRTAALITAHGAMKNFFAYWSVVDDQSDTRLEEAVALTEGAEDDSTSGRRELGYLSYALHDSHGFVFHPSEPPSSARIPALLDQSDTDEPVVRVSLVPELVPGDTLVAIDGVPVDDLMAERSQFVASSDSSAFRNAAATLLTLDAPATFQLRESAGNTRDEVIDPASLPSGYPVYPPARAPGPLGDLGHAELYYVNLDAEALTSAELPAVLSEIGTSQGLVLDMRGYPSQPAWTLMQKLLTQAAPGVPLRGMLVTPFARELEDLPQPFPAGSNAYQGKIAWIVGAYTQSQAEHLTLALQSANRIHVIGQPSAGANGNITGVLLPGGFGLTFTGMEVRQPDLGVFHGIGVHIDDEVAISPADLASGVDPELERAVAWLLTQ